MPLPIIQFGNKLLRTKTEIVPSGDIGNPYFRKLAREMIDTMEAEKGTGIASPQVGVSHRIAIMKFWKDASDEPSETIIAYNPSLTDFSDRKEYDWEGCLSLPDVWGKVKRPYSVVLDYVDEAGLHQKRDLTGFNARVAQHEVDHLDGILFVDRMDSMETLSTKKEAFKRMKEESGNDRPKRKK